MNNADLSGESSKFTASSMDDIPVAFRETPEAVPQSPSRRWWLMGGLAGLGAIALGTGLWVVTEAQQFPSTATPQNTASPSIAPSTTPTEAPSPNDTLLGHFPYKEASAQELQPISADGRIKLRKAAAVQFQAMVADARAQGVILVPISGFRAISEQNYLFFDVKAQRGQVAAERAAVSAPPGYSEHHTGYATDIGDGAVPATNLSTTFENTAAFKWLKANAARYSFELSFPKDNPQGVSYEPWHWRFVGDRDSLETFYKAKHLSPAVNGVTNQSSSENP